MTTRRSLGQWSALRVLLLVWVVGFVPVPTAWAQDDIQARRKSTEERLSALKSQIEQDQRRLAEAAQAEKSSQQTLDKLKREIALREELVATYQTRMDELEAERAGLRDTLGTLQSRLDDLREEYRVRAAYAYKYGRMHDLALILSSESINQMLIRIRYLRRFASQRRDRRTDIQQAAQAVEKRRMALEAKRERTEELLAEAQTERQNLRELQSDRRRIIREMRARRSELRAEIEEKQSQARELEQRVRDLIAAAEARAASGSAAEKAANAEVYANLSASFQENRGQLPWPAQGAITEGFGNRVDPVHGTTTYHPGILIATNPRSEVRAVFRGTVTGIDFVPGYGTYLVIRHGDFLSVYSNFSSLFVSAGDTVEAGDLLGRAGTDNEPRGAGLFFAVFDKTQNASVDPTRWLASR